MQVIHTDDKGFITHLRSDGSMESGDAVNWHGHYLYTFKNAKTAHYKTYRDHFKIGSGAWVRHFDPKMTDNGFGTHYKNPWNGVISRDQLFGILAAVIKFKDIKTLLEMILHHACWLFLFSYNTIDNGKDPKTAKWKWPDPASITVWAVYLRGFGLLSWLIIYFPMPFLWNLPVFVILDLPLLINAIVRKNKKDSEVISFLAKLGIATEFAPTPLSILALFITDNKEIENELKNYWGGWRNNGGMASLQLGKLRRLKEKWRLSK